MRFFQRCFLLCMASIAPPLSAHAFTLNELPVCVNLLVADLNADCLTDINDLEILNRNFNRSVTRRSDGDLNADGVVNAADLSILVANFGQECQCEGTPVPPTCP